MPLREVSSTKIFLRKDNAKAHKRQPTVGLTQAAHECPDLSDFSLQNVNGPSVMVTQVEKDISTAQQQRWCQ